MQIRLAISKTAGAVLQQDFNDADPPKVITVDSILEIIAKCVTIEIEA